jgi:hypothetical protein
MGFMGWTSIGPSLGRDRVTTPLGPPRPPRQAAPCHPAGRTPRLPRFSKLDRRHPCRPRSDQSVRAGPMRRCGERCVHAREGGAPAASCFPATPRVRRRELLPQLVELWGTLRRAHRAALHGRYRELPPHPVLHNQSELHDVDPPLLHLRAPAHVSTSQNNIESIYTHPNQPRTPRIEILLD